MPAPAHCSLAVEEGRVGGAGVPLTIHVVPGQELEGLIKQDDRQGYLEHHHPLAPTQWGHLENELRGEVWLKERLPSAPQSTCFTHPGCSGLSMGMSKMPFEVPPLDLCLPILSV